MIISSKPEYYALAARGALGNKFRTWASLEEYRASGYQGPTRFRSKIPGSKIFTTQAPFFGSVVERAYQVLLRKGATVEEIVFCEAAPEEFLVIQGEVCRGVGGLELAWSTEPGITNREAMTRARYSTGLSARMLLQRYLDPIDVEDLQELVDEYDDHVVEFSTYSRNVGIYNRSTVVWEVRLY